MDITGVHRTTFDSYGDDELIRAIRITGIPKDVSADTLELLFESRRKTGGGDIENVKYEEGSGEAIITFEQPSVAIRVLTHHENNEALVLGGKTISIQPYITPKWDGYSVLVTGIKTTVTSDLLKLYFESKKQSGGGNVQRVEIVGEDTAIVVFEDLEVASRVLAFEHRRPLNGSTLSLSQYVVEPPNPFVVWVTGINSSTTEETLILFFESPSARRAGGGQIQELQYEEGSREAIITFMDKEVAERVLHRKDPIVLEGCQLTVSHPTKKIRKAKPAINKCKIVVCDLQESITEDILQLYFESDSHDGGDIVDIAFDEEDSQAVITFQVELVAEQFVRKGSINIEGNNVIIKRYDPSEQPGIETDKPKPSNNKLHVTGLSTMTNKETLQLFFENRRIGGGQVEHIDYVIGSGEAVITFSDRKFAETLVRKNKQLRLDDSVLTIAPYSGNQGDERKILVQDIKPSTTKDGLLYFFESREFGCPEVIDIAFQNSSCSTAIVSFKEKQAAQNIISRKEPILLGGSVLRVSPYACDFKKLTAEHNKSDMLLLDRGSKAGILDSEDSSDIPMSRAIMVKDIPQHITYSALKQILQKHAPELTIKELTVPEKGVAFLDYNKSTDIDVMLRKDAPKTRDGSILNLVAVDTSIRNDPCYKGVNALCISNVPENISLAELELFFKTRKLSGTSEFSDVFTRKDKSVIVSFNTYSGVEQVLSKKNSAAGLMLKNIDLAVDDIDPPMSPILGNEPFDLNQFILINAPSATRKEFERFFSKVTDHKLVEVLFSYKLRTVKLVFSGQPDYHVLLRHCYSQPLHGQMMTIQRVSKPTMIQVHNVTLDKDTLTLYFDSVDPTSVGNIKVSQQNRDEMWAIVDVGDPEVVSRILQNDHTFNGGNMDVLPYYSEFGVIPLNYDSTRPWSNVPDPIVIPLPDERLWEFLSENKEGKLALEQQDKKLKAFSIDWVKSGPQGIRVTFFQQGMGPISDDNRITNWKEGVLIHMKKSFEKFKIEVISTTDEVFPKLDADIQIIQSISNILCTLYRDKYSIVVVGFASDVDAIKKDLIAKIQQEEIKLKHAKAMIKQTLEYENYLVSIIEQSNILTHMQISLPNLIIEKSTDGKIVLCGVPTDINNARLDLAEKIIHKIRTQNIPMSPMIFQYISKSSNLDYILDEFKERSIEPVSVVLKENEIKLVTLCDDHLKSGEKLLKESFIEKQIAISDAHQHIITSPMWQSLCQKHQDQYRGEFELKMEQGHIHVVGRSRAVNQILSELENHITENTILEKFISYDEKRVDFITKHWSSVISTIEERFKSSKVSIHLKPTGVLLSGTQPDFFIAEKYMNDTISRIMSHDHHVTEPWVAEGLRGEKGELILEDTESQHKVKLEIIDPVDAGAVGGSSSSEGSGCILRILARSRDHIEHAIKYIESKYELFSRSYTFNSDDEQKLIAKLNESQKIEMSNFASIFGVRITIEQKKRINRVHLEGSPGGVLECIEYVHSVLNNVKLQRREEWVHDAVESDDEMTDSIRFPRNWVTIPEGQTFHRQKLKHEEEFRDVCRRFQETLVMNPELEMYEGKPLYCSINKDNVTVKEIERIQNPYLYQSYMISRKYIKQKTPSIIQYERRLFHGTSKNTALAICRNGFDRRYCGRNAAKYGDGSYFATRSGISASDTYSVPDSRGHKYMFLCRALTGQSTFGRKGMKVPPPINPQDRNILYDSLNDKEDGSEPNLYVIFHDSYVYPEYLIEFKIEKK